MITVQEAKERKLMEQTEPSDPMERIETQWGMISIIDWLYKEKFRIELDETRIAEIVEDRRAYVSLWVNCVAGRIKH